MKVSDCIEHDGADVDPWNGSDTRDIGDDDGKDNEGDKEDELSIHLSELLEASSRIGIKKV